MMTCKRHARRNAAVTPRCFSTGGATLAPMWEIDAHPGLELSV